MLYCEHSFLKENSDGCFLNIHNYYDSSHQDRLSFSPSIKFALREKCPNAELFLVRIFLHWDRIRIPYGVNLHIVNLRILSQYRKIRTKNNYVFGQLSRSGLPILLFLSNNLIQLYHCLSKIGLIFTFSNQWN